MDPNNKQVWAVLEKIYLSPSDEGPVCAELARRDTPRAIVNPFYKEWITSAVYCTRPPQHEGPHVAHINAGHIVRIWD